MEPRAELEARAREGGWAEGGAGAPYDGSAAEPVVHALPLSTNAYKLPPVVNRKQQIDISTQGVDDGR